MGRPNLLLFMPDQLRCDAVGAFGSAVASTPTIDALAAAGVRFDQAFGQHSVCTQSRISMFTGWYPHVAGHRSITYLLQPHEPNVFRTLRDGGYHVALAGARGDLMAEGVTALSASRWGFTRPPDLAAVADWHRRRFDDDHRLAFSFYGGRLEGEPFDLDAATVATAVDWLLEGMPEPWCLLVPLVYPHPPFAVEEPWYSLHERTAMPRPIRPADGKPAFHDEIRRRYGLDALTDDDWREIAAVYHGMTSRVDHQLATILEAVDAVGQREATVTCCFTDHGEYLGDFGLVEKWPSGLEACLVRNPLVIHDPRARSGVASALVEMVDLTATLLDLAELEAGHTHFGRSLRPLLDDPGRDHRDAVYSEGGFLRSEGVLLEPDADGHYRHKRDIQRDLPELVGKAMAVRTAEWTYVERLYEPPELYERRSDPDETRNLAGSGRDDVIAEHRDLLTRWMLETSDVFPWTPDRRREGVLRDALRPRDRAGRGARSARSNDEDALHARRLAALAEAAMVRSETAELLDHVTELVVSLLPATAASLILWDPEAEAFHLSASTLPAQSPRYVLGRVRTRGGASRWIVDHQEPLAVTRRDEDPFTASTMLLDADLQAYLGVPLVFEGESLGVLYALDAQPREYASADIDFMTILARRAASAIGFARLFEQVRELASTDDLTGVWSRRELMARYETEIERSRRTGQPLSVIVFDLDEFKAVNDRHGHQVGDRVLVEVAHRCRGVLRSIDLLGRIGGEEFAVALPDVDLAAAAVIAERLRRVVADHPIEPEGIATTITLGVAELAADEDLTEMLDRADRALYAGKSAGRDRVVTAHGPNRWA